MRFRPLLFHKLIGVVLIPLVFEIVLAAWMLDMSATADRDTQLEYGARRASADLNDLYERITGAAQTVAGMVLRQGNTPDVLDFNSQQASIEGDLKDIRQLVVGEPELLKQVDELDAYVGASLGRIDESLSDSQSGNRLASFAKLKYLKGTVPVIIEKLKVLRSHFDDTAIDAANSAQTRRAHLRSILAASIPANVLIVLALVIFIYRNIMSRLMVIMDNTGRLARDEVLMPPVAGTDEIAHLDKVFKDMAHALEQARRKREEIERLKQEFVAMVSHDLRTPLTSIQVFLNMLGRGMLGETSEKIKDKAVVADRNATRLISLINDLLDMEKMESGQFDLACEDIPVSLFVDRSLESVRAVADKNNVSLTATACSINVRADADRIVQVMINLLGNAIKFSPEHGTVSICVEADGELVKVKIADQGRGIPASMRDAIFDRFKQVDTKDATEKKGTGLGLAICKAIVEQHGGTIGVDSILNKGSTFWFTLPTSKQQLQATQVGSVNEQLSDTTA